MLTALPGRTRIVFGLALLLSSPAALSAAVPADGAKKAEAIGQPLSLAAQPTSITLVGPRALQQLVITGSYADKSVRDLTPFCEWTAESGDILSVTAGAFGDEGPFVPLRGDHRPHGSIHPEWTRK